MISTDLTSSLLKAILMNAKVNESVVDKTTGNLEDLIFTMSSISALGRYDSSIKAGDGNRYGLDEYKVDKRLSPLVTPRSVTLTSDENSPELKVGTLIGEVDANHAHNIEQAIITNCYESLGIEPGAPLESMDYVIAGAKVGYLINTIDINCYDGKGKVNHTCKVQTPGKFMEAQNQLFSLFKSSIGGCTDMQELTKPVLLSDVLNRVDNGKCTLSTTIDNLTLPITLKCVNFLYKDYMYSYPLEDFIREFVSHFVVTSLCARPAE